MQLEDLEDADEDVSRECGPCILPPDIRVRTAEVGRCRIGHGSLLYHINLTMNWERDTGWI